MGKEERNYAHRRVKEGKVKGSEVCSSWKCELIERE